MSVPQRQETPSFLQVDAILSRLTGEAALSEVCRFLRQEFRHYSWVGVYRLEGELLKLAGWSGDAPTEHTEIPMGRGICGLAAREDRSVIVGDVRTRPEFLACFPETRSEIVVPIRAAGRVLGEIDIDGWDLNAFDASDARFLERVAGKLVPALSGASAGPPAKA